jgi:ankyrin repeat protein
MIGQSEIVQKLINLKANPKLCNRQDLNALQLASEGGFSDVVELLVPHIGPNEALGDTLPPLHLASQHGHLLTAKALVENGANFKLKAQGSTPLHLASERGCLAVVKWLISGVDDVQNKASTEPTGALSLLEEGNYEGNTPLHLTAKTNQSVAFRELLSEVAKSTPDLVRRSNNDGLTPLSLAALNGHTEIIDEHLRARMEDRPKEALIAVAKKGISRMVDYLLRKGWECNSQDENGRTPLRWASENGFVETVRVLLRAGARPDLVDDENDAPLHAAVQKREMEVIGLLVFSASPNLQLLSNKSGDTPLFIAVECHNELATKFLLIHGNKDIVNTKCSNGRTALHAAANNVEITKTLLENEAEPNKIDDSGSTPLILAAGHGNLGVIKLLISHGAELDTVAKGGSALSTACEEGHLSCAKWLINAGADINLQDEKEATPLYLSIANNRIDVAKLLLAHQATIDLSSLQAAARHGSREILDMLLRSSADINAVGGTFQTALEAAFAGGNQENVQLLLEHGADPTKIDEQGLTSIHRWVLRGTDAVGDEDPGISIKKHFDLLASAPTFNIDVEDEAGRAPLLLAVSSTESNLMVEILLRHGANPNKTDKQGRTPLMRAILGHKTNMVSLLLDNEANITTVDGRGQGLLYWAARKECEDIFNIILNKLQLLGDKQKRISLLENALHGTILAGRLDLLLLLRGINRSPETQMEGGVGVSSDNTKTEALDINAKDVHGWTPLFTAEQYKLSEIVEYLKSQNAVGGDGGRKRPTKWHDKDVHHSLRVSKNGREIEVEGEWLCQHKVIPRANIKDPWACRSRCQPGQQSSLFNIRCGSSKRVYAG